MFFFSVFLVSSVTGLLSALMGIGGGLLYVPLFKMICYQKNFSCLAVDSIHLSMLVILCSNAPSLIFSKKRTLIRFEEVKGYLAPFLLGLLLAQQFVYHLSDFSHDLLLFFLTLYLLAGIRYCLFPTSASFLSDSCFSLCVGLITGATGVGGSLFFVPLWRQRGFSYKEISAASTFFVVLASLGVNLMALFKGWQPPINLFFILFVASSSGLINYLVSSYLTALPEKVLKLSHLCFFITLASFYLLRIYFHVFA